MEGSIAQPYPGENASAVEFVEMANAYRAAFDLLHRELQARRDERTFMWSAPVRLCGLHAIELYLSAFLIFSGKEYSCVRSMGHSLQARAQVAIDSGLVIKKRTREHLQRLTEGREYLVTRYDPAQRSRGMELTAIQSILAEIAHKVPAALAQGRKAA